MKAKKILKWAAGILLALVLVVAAYVIYVFAAYHRIEDKQVIKPEHNVERRVEAKTPYTITTFNIGFGAYSADYSFLWTEEADPGRSVRTQWWRTRRARQSLLRK